MGVCLHLLRDAVRTKSFWRRNTERMEEVFERIALELRRQYSIGYLPSNFVANGKWHRIKVTVTNPQVLPQLVVRSREGYYAVNKLDNRRGFMRHRKPSCSLSSRICLCESECAR